MPLVHSTAAPDTGWSVRCAACGSCCNSPPLLSLPELFRHQHLFIGTLGLRRVRRVRTGDTLGRGGRSYQADNEDGAAVERLVNDCLHRIPDPNDDLLLAPLGFDDPGLGRCPALGEDGRCTLHGRQKPAMCAAVPFDPLMPDRLQHLVLAERWADSDDLGARCIARTGDPRRMSVLGTRLLDGDARRALLAARQSLIRDKCIWGSAIVAELAAQPETLARIPRDAFAVLPLPPVLKLLATVSGRCRERCLDYLDAQLVLCERASRAPRVAQRLRPIVHEHRVLRDALVARTAGRRAGKGPSVGEVEAWLEPPERPVVSVFLGGDR